MGNSNSAEKNIPNEQKVRNLLLNSIQSLGSIEGRLNTDMFELNEVQQKIITVLKRSLQVLDTWDDKYALLDIQTVGLPNVFSLIAEMRRYISKSFNNDLKTLNNICKDLMKASELLHDRIVKLDFEQRADTKVTGKV